VNGFLTALPLLLPAFLYPFFGRVLLLVPDIFAILIQLLFLYKLQNFRFMNWSS